MNLPHNIKNKSPWWEELIAYSILLLTWFLLLYFLHSEESEIKERYLKKQITTQEIAWQASLKIHKTSIESYLESILNTPYVIDTLQDALSAELEDSARERLYQLLQPKYQKLIKNGIEVLHFHTPNNHSFLRFHQPQKYGDNLTNLRFSVVKTNKTLMPAHGFETGRVISGFRHVFPIIHQSKHLGSVEISQDFEPLRFEIDQLDAQREYSLIQKAEAIHHKSFSEFSSLFTPSLYSSEWLVQGNTHILKAPETTLSKTGRLVAELVKQDSKINTQLQMGKSFSKIYLLQNKHYAVTFTAIHDVQGKNSAYLVSTTTALDIDANQQQFLIYKLSSTLLLLFLALAIRRIIHSKHTQAETRHYLESVSNAMTEGLYATDIQGNITQINNAALNLLGYSKEQLINQNAHLIFHLSQDDTDIKCPLESATAGHSSYEGELIFVHASGEQLIVQVSSQPLRFHNKISGSVVAFHDITRQKSYEQTIKLAATTFETQNAIMITDNQGIILRVNQSFTRLTGYQAEEVIGKTPSILSSGKQSASFYQKMWEELQSKYFWQDEIWNKRKDGSLYVEWLTITAVLDNKKNITQYVANFSDVTERHHAQAEIEKLAFYDPLTNLPNRRLLWDRLEQALQKTKRSQQYGVVFFIDLDKFKILNDSKGHQIGDLLLMQVSQLLKSNVRQSDTVARIGGDEFIILMEDLGAESLAVSEHAEQVALNIIKEFAKEFDLDGYQHHCSPSIGIELFNSESKDADEVLMHADVAMYQAKQHGRNTVRFFSNEMQEQIDNITSMQADLRKALAENEFELFYQPQVNENSKITSCEALIRWNHPQKGLIPPTEFISLAEESGLIVPLGEFVIEQACRQLVSWQNNPELSSIQIAVNVSAKQFANHLFVKHVLQTIELHNINPNLLKIELTESLVIENIDQTIDTMNRLRQVGIEFAFDDFGTGYSSLSVIKHLPLSQIKIDQSFIRDLGKGVNDGNESIVKTIIAMANTLNLEVIAEGVETIQQQQVLYQSGCNLYQGYLFSKPLPIADFEDLVENLFALQSC